MSPIRYKKLSLFSQQTTQEKKNIRISLVDNYAEILNNSLDSSSRPADDGKRAISLPFLSVIGKKNIIH